MYCLTLKLLIHLLFFYRIFNLEKKVVETENPFFLRLLLFLSEKISSVVPLSFLPLKKYQFQFLQLKKKEEGKRQMLLISDEKGLKEKPWSRPLFPLIYGCPVSRKSHLFPQKRKKKSLFYSSFPVSICQLRGRKRRKLIEGGKKRRAHALIEEKRLISTLGERREGGSICGFPRKNAQVGRGGA